ncbi:1-acyl-sn-glycerol-3-phosphate acyltransferase [Corynebacterium sp. CNCTC7651]|uniref:lysophospholipid acyltransferase family protein n=1 Tax=Corynebacterium sp. CNCTC7651 TaxID=2815361 RepID=UPI001F3DD1FD|nr:lysophospholipid acyltransferase family protein [Corynebacterium sp. CNCTC7651]UIZ92039.1 1-acyl-sn-glycerol-3-phosphate acyltransferase [Corynebacterium sp. CNCTC7651]
MSERAGLGRRRGLQLPASYTSPADHPVESKERFYQGAVGVARRLLGFTRIDVTLHGLEHIPQRGGALLAGNHTGYYDFVLMGAGPHIHGNRLVRFMAKQSVFGIPVLGGIMQKMGHVPVDRARGAGAIDAAVAELRRGRLVGIFPEATISRSFELAKFKTGAARIAHAAGVPLIPCVMIWGSQRIWTKDLPKQLRGVPVIVRYGEPVALTGDAEADTERLKAAMQLLLDESRNLVGIEGGEAWMPASLGGTAPSIEEAEEIYAREREARAAKKAAKAEKRAGNKRRKSKGGS